jgi:hypothetical protein
MYNIFTEIFIQYIKYIPIYEIQLKDIILSHYVFLIGQILLIILKYLLI